MTIVATPSPTRPNIGTSATNGARAERAERATDDATRDAVAATPTSTVSAPVNDPMRDASRVNPAFGRGAHAAAERLVSARVATQPISATNPNPLYTNGDKPDWQSVEQRDTNDCWFVSSVLAIARDHPDAIKSMIKDNNNGTYSVTFPGIGKTVTVTPPDPSDRRYGASNGCWLGVMEKAWGTHLMETGPRRAIQTRTWPDPVSPKIGVEQREFRPGRREPQTLDRERKPPPEWRTEWIPTLRTPAEALECARMVNEPTLAVGNPQAGMTPFFASRDREMIPIWRPSTALTGLIGHGERMRLASSTASSIESGLANKKAITAATNVATVGVGGVSNRQLSPGHVYAVIGFTRDRNSTEGSIVKLRDPYGKIVNITLQDYLDSVGFMGLQR